MIGDTDEFPIVLMNRFANRFPLIQQLEPRARYIRFKFGHQQSNQIRRGFFNSLLWK
jgi:hypothetical protein